MAGDGMRWHERHKKRETGGTRKRLQTKEETKVTAVLLYCFIVCRLDTISYVQITAKAKCTGSVKGALFFCCFAALSFVSMPPVEYWYIAA